MRASHKEYREQHLFMLSQAAPMYLEHRLCMLRSRHSNQAVARLVLCRKQVLNAITSFRLEMRDSNDADYLCILAGAYHTTNR